MRKFCPKCGKITDNFYDNLCRNCFLENISILDKLPEGIKIRICKFCGRILVDKKYFDTVEKAVDHILASLLDKLEVKSASYRISKNKVYVSIKLKFDDIEKSEEKSISLLLKYITCELCSIKAGRYYNSIIQIRSKNPERIFRGIEKKMHDINKSDPYAFISKIEKIPHGYDIYIGSKSAASRVANYIKSKYNVKIKITRKLSGSISGKKSYKDTILISED